MWHTSSMTNTCQVCGSKFDAPTTRFLTCSDDCRAEFRRWPRWSERTCEWCGASLSNDKHHPKRFCSLSCRNSDRAKTRQKVCFNCGDAFKASRPEQIYCSHKCFGEQYSGRGSRGGEVPLCRCGQPILNKARVFCSDECQQEYATHRSRSHPDIVRACLTCEEQFSRPWYYAGKLEYCSTKCQQSSIKTTSRSEVEVRDFVESFGIRTEKLLLPSGRHVDIFCPDLNVGFEYNGAFYHSEAGMIRRRVKKNKIRGYHLSKTLECEAQGVFLYHIWEWEWKNWRKVEKQEIIKSQIMGLLNKMEVRLQARKCYVDELDGSAAQIFYEQNHLIGRMPSQHHYGLFFGGDLVAAMSFSLTEKGWELIRYCVRRNTSVAGGAGRLFSRFLKDHAPELVISYSDRAKTTGVMYEMLGFTHVRNTAPEYVNYHPNTKDVRRRYQTMKRVLARDFPSSDLSMSEKQITEQLGYTRVYGCGNKVWVWRQDNQS